MLLGIQPSFFDGIIENFIQALNGIGGLNSFMCNLWIGGQDVIIGSVSASKVARLCDKQTGLPVLMEGS